jgi:mono/diheme cytochrome c family protein
MTRWLAPITVCMFLVGAGEAGAQPSTKQAPRTTKSGVYSPAQANRGADVYMGMCKNCHTPEFHTAPAFTAKWNGKPLSVLYEYIRDEMPKNEPGSLSEQEYIDVLAYVLKLNHMPSGKAELSPESKKLAAIRVDIRGPVKVTKSSKGSSP